MSCHRAHPPAPILVKVLEVQREPLEQGDFVMCPLPPWGRREREGSSMSGNVSMPILGEEIKTFLRKQTVQLWKHVPHHRVTACTRPADTALPAPSASPECAHTHTRVCDIKVIFLVAGEARLSLPLPQATRCQLPFYFPTPPWSACRLYLYR